MTTAPTRIMLVYYLAENYISTRPVQQHVHGRSWSTPAACKCRSPPACPIVDARSMLRHAWMLELMSICEELKQLHTDSIMLLALLCVPALMCTFTWSSARSPMAWGTSAALYLGLWGSFACPE